MSQQSFKLRGQREEIRRRGANGPQPLFRLTPGTARDGVGDTVEVSFSLLNNGLYTVESADDLAFTVAERGLKDEIDVTATLVRYPDDVKMGVINLLKWEMENRDKVGVASETISRHAVTYFDLTGENAVMGFPRALMGFLTPYIKARFGQGVTAT